MYSRYLFKFQRMHIDEKGKGDKWDLPVFLEFTAMDDCVPTEEQLDALLAAFRSGITHSVWRDEDDHQ